MRAALVIAFALSVVWGGTAEADYDPDIDAGTTDGGLIANAIGQGEKSVPTGDGQSVPFPGEPTIVVGQEACSGADQAGASTELDVSFCNSAELPQITAADVQRAFAELKLPAGTLTIQPPDGLTLVNFKTNFYTTSTTPISTSVTLLGQQVTLEATPASFAWNFGDGESTSTTEPGAPYPDLTITHSYLRKGDYLPSLSTTYTGRYRIATGPWQPIPGTVTIDGPGQPLRAVEAQPKLVGY